jgi:hypothetical protein
VYVKYKNINAYRYIPRPASVTCANRVVGTPGMCHNRSRTVGISVGVTKFAEIYRKLVNMAGEGMRLSG